MSFTRFHDDDARIKKQLQESTFAGRYQLNAPGPGENLPFIEDPHMRLEKWGANNRTNGVDLESDLKGMSRKYNRDNVNENNYKDHSTFTLPQSHSIEKSFVDQTRASHPAWTYLDVEQNRWELPFNNPQSHTEKTFENNSSSRILVKDNHK
jgi:hypothetical protein